MNGAEERRVVDRGLVRMVAMKRIITGSLSLACGVALVVALVVHGSPPPTSALGLLIFFGGGAWTLRDGLRLRRELLR
jgi:hypothetical protein